MKKSTTFLFILLLIGFVISCGDDPWTTGADSTDIVTITKTTKFTGKEGDLISKKLKLNKIKKSPLMKAAVGSVKMSHLVHTDIGLKCIDCHHVENNKSRIKKCALCHRGNDGFDKLHQRCLDCHMKKRNGIEKCLHCH